MRNRIFRAVVAWKDGDVEDADEFEVFSPTPAAAEREARKRWRLTFGMKFPTCSVQDVTILGTARHAGGGRAR